MAPTEPPAPVRFSTTTGWPQSSPSFGAMVRAMMSVTPPGENATITRTGLAGQFCASAGLAAASMSRNARVLRLVDSFDNLVGPEQERARQLDSKQARGAKVHKQLEFRRLFDRQFANSCTPQDAIHVLCRNAVEVRNVSAIG